VGLADLGGVCAPENNVRTRGKEETGRARGVEGLSPTEDSEFQGGARVTIDQGVARGTREPGGA